MTPPAGRPRSSSLDRETRQLLEELDALMQRMLALPVEPPDDLANPPIQEAAGETSSESTSASSETDSGAAAAAEPAILVPVEQPKSYSSRSTLAENGAPALVPELPFANEGSRRISPQNMRGVRPAWPLYPLLGINWAFDQATRCLGPLGRWLRGLGGRALLGWTGLLLVVVALAWLAWDGLGWTW